jgi:hypothetical protein
MSDYATNPNFARLGNVKEHKYFGASSLCFPGGALAELRSRYAVAPMTKNTPGYHARLTNNALFTRPASEISYAGWSVFLVKGLESE